MTDNAASQDKKLTLDDVVSGLKGSFGRPKQFRFCVDGESFLYLQSASDSATQSLWHWNLKTDEKKCLFDGAKALQDRSKESLEEALLIERQRQRGAGITSYSRFPASDKVLLTVKKNLLVVDHENGESPTVTELTRGDSPCLDPKISRSGAWVYFCRDGELHRVADDLSRIEVLTDGESGTSRGLADYLAQEEMGRSSGYFPSPADGYVAYFEVDDQHIPEYPIVHQGKDEVIVETHRFPFTGKENPSSKLFLLNFETRRHSAVEALERYDHEIYIPRVYWLSDRALLVLVQNRAQTWQEMLKIDPKSGESTVLFREEREDSWINLHSDFYPIDDAKSFLWLSEDSGFQHVYKVDAETGTKTQLTDGEWIVTEIVSVDEADEYAVLKTTQSSPINRDLARLNLKTGELTPIHKAEGWNGAVCSGDGLTILNSWSSLETAGHVGVLSIDSSEHKILWSSDKTSPESQLPAPEVITVENDGVTLYGALYKANASSGRAPLIVYVYGGPHAQRVQNQWGVTTDMRCHYLNQLGFHVLKLDNRGSANRGLAFETPLRHETGRVEVRDQVAGVNALVERGLVDPERVGVIGWSYGGYMTLMCLLRAPEVFKAGVSGAPVTHWDSYDTHYTERYMGLMDENPEGYARSAVLDEVESLQGELLLIHGMIDENVHFRHSARLINALIEADKDFETLILPDERHMPRQKRTKRYMERKVSEFFTKTIG